MSCSKCRRRQPDFIADPTCTLGGYCQWAPPKDAHTTPEDLFAHVDRVKKVLDASGMRDCLALLERLEASRGGCRT